MSKFKIKTIFFPGKILTDTNLEQLVTNLRSVAADCFEQVPNYQALTGNREELERTVISLAYNDEEEIVAFCSSLVLTVPKYGQVLHLGLTCVSKKARGRKLTHKLLSKLLIEYQLKESPLRSVYVTNCACVLSSLGNVALYFENVYPSPFKLTGPSAEYIEIAKYIADNYREPIAIKKSAKFNFINFVFEGSVQGDVFEKDENDLRFHHRDPKLNRYYKNLLDFQRGDEVLQIGKLSPLTLPKYLWRTSKRKSSLLINQLSATKG